MGRISVITNLIKRERKNLMISLCIGVVITTVFAVNQTRIYAQEIQEDIASKVVRFHVLANSDTVEDQNLKLLVRDNVLEFMKEKMETSKDIDETNILIEKNIEDIKSVAEETVISQGYDYNVNVIMSRDLFPLKQYGDTVFPAGMYDALRIEIGNAEGYNWWCVMFPPLCFVDGTKEELTPESKKQLKSILSEEEYEIITSPSKKSGTVPKIKFKVVEIWQELKSDNKKYVTKA